MRPRLVPVVLALLLAAALPAAMVPRKASEFTIHLTNGRQVPLSQFKGKTVAMIFILTYCPHCQKTIGFLSKEQAEYGPRGFQALASTIEEAAAAAVPGFLKRFNPPFPVGYNARGAVLEFLQHPMAERLLMPQLVFMDRDGNIRAQYAGDDPFLNEDRQETNIRQKIEQLLTEDAAPPQKGALPRKK
jgi:peroxiredoxin